MYLPSLCQSLLCTRQLLFFSVHQQRLVLERLLAESACMLLNDLPHDHVQVLLLAILLKLLGLRLLLLAVPAQVGHLLHGQDGIRVALVYHTVRHALLVDLPVIDLLLQAVVHHKAVHKTGFFLTISAQNIMVTVKPAHNMFSRSEDEFFSHLKIEKKNGLIKPYILFVFSPKDWLSLLWSLTITAPIFKRIYFIDKTKT